MHLPDEQSKPAMANTSAVCSSQSHVQLAAELGHGTDAVVEISTQMTIVDAVRRCPGGGSQHARFSLWYNTSIHITKRKQTKLHEK